MGIVDCAPRIFSMKEKIIFSKIRPRFIRNKLLKFLSAHRFFITKYFKKYYTKINDFNKYYRLIIKEIIKIPQLKKIIIINISSTNKNNNNKSYNFGYQINKYNHILMNIYN